MKTLNQLIEEEINEIYVNHLEDLMRQADLAVRCEVKDKEKYYETLRNGSRQLLDAFRQSLTNIAKATVKNAKTKRSVIAKPVKVDFYDKKGEKLYFKGNRTKNLK